MTQPFEIETGEAGNFTSVVRVRGPLDARGAPVVTRACAEVRARGRHLVLHLAGVTFVASSGVGALLALVEAVRHARSRVRLAEASPAILSVVRLLNLESFLSLCPSEAEAVEQLEAMPSDPAERAA